MLNVPALQLLKYEDLLLFFIIYEKLHLLVLDYYSVKCITTHATPFCTNDPVQYIDGSQPGAAR